VNPVAYVYEIARNEAVRTSGKRRRTSATPLPAGELFAANGDFRRAEDAEMAAMALGRLDDDDRELVELKIYGGLTFQEIAAVVGRPAATVATRYRRAIESLRPWVTKQLRW
jgi:RNA polymerase sigma-70 factor (ECF subfamily)